MPSNSNSQCQLFQLHIDAYLDNELEPSRAEELRLHLCACETCSAEFAYAEQLHRAVVDLPILDCSDQALEPVDRLFAAMEKTGQTRRSAGGMLSDFIASLPGLIRYGVPAAAVVLLSIGLGGRYLSPRAGTELVGQQIVSSESAPQYTQAEIIQALQDLEIAIDYLGQISQRTNVMIEDRFLLRQLEDSINASFRERGTGTSVDDGTNGPI